VTVDGNGNVYVGGYTNAGPGVGGYDYTTIKYYPNGDTAWLRGYNGQANGDDIMEAMAVDKYGNVYVTGLSRVVFSEGYYYATIKYYPNGDTAWLRSYKGAGLADDRGYKLAVDDSGNVYVTGFSDGGSTGIDCATIKYKPNGDTAWVRRYDSPVSSNEYATALAVDDSGNVYVAGYGGSDYLTVKYYPNGDTAWVRTYDGPVHGYDDINPTSHGLTVDDSGNVYVTGRSTGSGTGLDIATIKYTSNGATLWVNRYEGAGDDQPNDIIIGTDGYVYVTGTTWNGTSDDYITLKYTPGGDTVWTKRYNGPGNGLDRVLAMAMDNNSNVYVTGRSYDFTSSYDYATVKYKPNGDSVWVMRYNGPGNGFDRGTSIAVDDGANVYVTGESADSGGFMHFATIKYVQAASDSLTVSANANWNMLSVPLTVSDSSKTSIYPAAVSDAFAYEDAYVVRATLANGVGYWMKFPSAQSTQMTGIFRMIDNFVVAEGWNLIGSISSPVAVSTITSTPPGLVTSEFFGYDGRYEPVTTIEPGRGYWVNVSASGTLHLSSSMIESSSGRIRIVHTFELPPAPPAN
ncbi:MAG TPA: SBBP repeat-containing protein, partial [Saprospiraceae bacterium]|nr:SBBP repeat-containing protein [Saprospiraceae bacterium]